MSTKTVPTGTPNSAGWQGGLKSALGGPWANVAMVACLAIVLGLMLPKILSSETVIEKDRPRTDAKVSTTDVKTSVLKDPAVAEYKAPAFPDGPNPHVLLGRLFMGTVTVLGLSVVSIWVMRRWVQGQGPANANQREMRLMETLYLGNRASLHLVHLGKREILVGADAGGIKSIVQLAGPFDDALAEAERNDAAAESAPFIGIQPEEDFKDER